ncbi:AbrB/MazE/SpoVT family DNA-binding domain-containing protein [Saccharopolyspora sp. NPDC002376]
MKMTEKGQVTIPVDLRRELGLRPGDQIEIRLEGDALILTRDHSVPSRGQRMVDLLRGSGHGEMTTDEIMELTRGE